MALNFAKLVARIAAVAKTVADRIAAAGSVVAFITYIMVDYRTTEPIIFYLH